MASVSTEAAGGDLLAQSISEMVSKKTREIMDEECAGVAQRVRERLQGAVGEIAGRVLQSYDMSRSRGVVTIEVRTGPEESKG